MSRPMVSSALWTCDEWLDALRPDQGESHPLFRDIFNNDAELLSARLGFYRRILEFAQDKMQSSRGFLVRCPARINLMGMHIEHQGGEENPICIPREHFAVVAPLDTDEIILHNQDASFGDRQYRIGDLMPAELRGKDWRAYCLENAPVRPNDWGNYAVGAAAQVQGFRADATLRGFRMVVGSDIPLASGLSSSTALTLLVMKALIVANQLSVADHELIRRAGAAELVVGTLGGDGDGSAMINAQPGRCVHHSFFPYRATTYELPSGLGIVLANSFAEAEKQSGAKDTFNERITCYRLGRLVLGSVLTEQGITLENLGQLVDGSLGLPNRRLYQLVKRLPCAMTRQQAYERLGSDHSEELDFIFSTHAEPRPGYRVRRRVLFGLGEMDRARRFMVSAQQGDCRELGCLKTIGHNGDRVQWPIPGFETPDDDHYLDLLALNDFPLAYVNGGYECSTPELDDLVDTALELDCVYGAGLTGAGLGGSVVVLCQRQHVERAMNHLRQRYYQRRNLSLDGIQEVQPIKGITAILPDDLHES